jgi:hypothetical protein
MDADQAISAGLATASDDKQANKQPKKSAAYLGLMGCKTTEPPEVVADAVAELRKVMLERRVHNALDRS